MSIKSKLRGPFARVAANLVIGVAGLLVIRLIAQGLPMFQDAGWIVGDKLTVLAGSVRNLSSRLPVGSFCRDPRVGNYGGPSRSSSHRRNRVHRFQASNHRLA